MNQVEAIEVYLKTNRDGETICMCAASKKKCDRDCDKDIVFRDRYLDWIKTMNGRY